MFPMVARLATGTAATQHLGDGQHQVGGGGAAGQLAGEPEPHHLRDQHGDRLAQHGCLGLDAADAPAEDAEAVLHGGVRVGAQARVGVSEAVAGHHHAGQVLDVHLVDDARAGRDHLELAERLLAPAQEREPLPVALELDLHVPPERIGAAEHVGNHRMVDDQLGGDQRVDLLRVTAEGLHGLAHGGQVDHGGHAGQVLQDHPGRGELDLGVRLAARFPPRQRVHVVRGDVDAVLGAEQVLQQDLQAEREAFGAGHGVQPADLVLLACNIKRRPAAEAVHGHRPEPPRSRLRPAYSISISRYLGGQAETRSV
jgi:hypothetical protein